MLYDNDDDDDDDGDTILAVFIIIIIIIIIFIIIVIAIIIINLLLLLSSSLTMVALPTLATGPYVGLVTFITHMTIDKEGEKNQSVPLFPLPSTASLA